MTVKVSVIIPVYNTEQFLGQCLDSVISQTLKEIEIICVDDGSRDGSAAILRQYAAEDGRVRIITQQNSGLGNARNNGVKNATGEYIAFLDSDDWLAQTALEKLYTQAVRDDADICMCGRINHLDYYGKDVSYNILPDKTLYPREQPFNLDRHDNLFDFSDFSVWNKLYRRLFLKENRIDFLPVRLAEDIHFTSLVIFSARKITVLYEPLIHYRVMRSESLTATIYKTPEVYLDVWINTAKTLRSRGVFHERCIANLAWASILWLIQRTKWPEYPALYNRLKTEMLPSLGIRLHEPGYYVHPWQEDLLRHLYEESAEEFIMSYMLISEIKNRGFKAVKQAQTDKIKKENKSLQKQIEEQNGETETYRIRSLAQEVKIRELGDELTALRDELGALKASRSCRIGQIITLILGKIKVALIGRKTT